MARRSRAIRDSSSFAARSSGRRTVVGDGVDGVERRRRSPAAAPQLLAGVVGDRRQDVLADLLVAELVVSPLEGPQRPQPCVGIDVLDLVVAERSPKGAADHRPGRTAKLRVETARSLAPFRRALGRSVAAAGGGDRTHARVSTLTTPPCRSAPPAVTNKPSPPLNGPPDLRAAPAARAPVTASRIPGNA